VRKLHVAYTGQQVTAGQPLFAAYSPELFTAESEYLLALRNARSLTNSAAADRQAADSLADSAHRRLELLEVGDAEIRDLETRGKAGDELLFRAPLSGHVITKNAVEGQSFMAGGTLYEIGDMTHLWLRASLFEYEISEVTTGATARAVFPHLNNLTLPCSVQFIYPHIDAQTRRAEIRLNLDNANHLVRPGMWANVELEIPLGESLMVPSSALIDTGTRQIAFVDRADGHLEPREVKAGATADEYTQVISGLKAGEKVVTRALFMIDSESQLKAAIAGMGEGHSH
jgi:membrane fusion protein, copper/silver efflux system